MGGLCRCIYEGACWATAELSFRKSERHFRNFQTRTCPTPACPLSWPGRRDQSSLLRTFSNTTHSTALAGTCIRDQRIRNKPPGTGWGRSTDRRMHGVHPRKNRLIPPSAYSFLMRGAVTSCFLFVTMRNRTLHSPQCSCTCADSCPERQFACLTVGFDKML